MFAAARVGDTVTHDALVASGAIGPPIAPSPKPPVLIEGLPAAHVTCIVVCSGATSAGPAHSPPPTAAPPPPIVMGEPTVLINGFPAARWAPSGDLTACGAMLGEPKLAIARTVLIGKPSAGMTKGPRLQTRKWQIGLGLAKAAELPEGDDNEELKAAAERFAKNNQAIEKARLAENIYNHDAPAPEGWRNISQDAEALRKIGLQPSHLSEPGSEFRAQAYAPDPAVFGDDQKPTVAFQGTRPKVGEDWNNNIAQGRDKDSLYYQKSVAIGKRLKANGSDAEITGHSLGGGMASAASRASGKPATTFNAAGLHQNTVARYGGTVHVPEVENIQAYRVRGEVLTGLQEHGVLGTGAAIAAGLAVGGVWGALIIAGKIALARSMPNAVGTPHVLDGSWDPISRHGMDQVIAGIESQKAEDQAAILAALS